MNFQRRVRSAAAASKPGRGRKKIPSMSMLEEEPDIEESDEEEESD